MNFYTSGMFWFIEGILLTIVVIGIYIWAEDRQIKLNLFNWVLIILWILWFEFSLAFVTTSFGEGEPTAATLGGIVFGLISIISGVALFRILISKKLKKLTSDNEA